MADFLGKKYKLDTSENFDEYMKALGVGLVTRKMGNAISPTVELTESDGKYTLSTTSTFKNQALVFANGEEIDEETPDGRKVKSVLSLEGNVLTHKQLGEKESTIIRTFSESEMKAVMTLGEIVCTRTYKLVQ